MIVKQKNCFAGRHYMHLELSWCPGFRNIKSASAAEMANDRAANSSNKVSSTYIHTSPGGLDSGLPSWTTERGVMLKGGGKDICNDNVRFYFKNPAACVCVCSSYV